MEIAIMGGWNISSGGAIHAESIGREFIKMGHRLNVFTFYDYAYFGWSLITGRKNEDYVHQCFTSSTYTPQKLDPRPFLTSNYELFIAEDIGILPKDLLAKIYNTHIRKKAKTISVYHDDKLSDDPSFYQFDWDAIVCFDERYRDILLRVYPKEIIHIIPYPCNPWNPGDKNKSREQLNLPKDRKIIFTFGMNTKRVLTTILWLKKICKEYPVTILGLIKSKDPKEQRKIIKEYKKLKKELKCEIIIKEESPDIEKVYQYLYASDLLLYYRPQTPYPAVVASTILQCLGSGCPIVGNNSKYTEKFNGEIFKYRNEEEFVWSIKQIFDETSEYKSVLEKAKKYVEQNSSYNIAKKFLQLYEEL